MSDDKFEGFDIPKQNWFKLPNNWTEVTAGMSSRAEILVVQYVLRHTWGYQEYNIHKKLTVDEFVNGRKRKDGTRMDKGTGLSNKSVWSGIKNAVEHGYLEVDVDDTDKGRIKKYYRLRLHDEVNKLRIRNVEFTSNCTNVDTSKRSSDCVERTNPLRTNNESIRERNLGKIPKNTQSHSNDCDGETDRTNGQSDKTTPSDFDIKAAQKLKHIAQEILGNTRSINIKESANDIRKLRQKDKVSEKEIHRVIMWYSKKDNCTDTYTPVCRCGKSFRAKFDNLRDAIKRQNNNSTNDSSGDTYKEPTDEQAIYWSMFGVVHDNYYNPDKMKQVKEAIKNGATRYSSEMDD